MASGDADVGFWRRLKGVEARWLVAPMQRATDYDVMEPLIKLTKTCTRRSAYLAYGAALVGACPRSRYAELVVAFVCSRRLNEWLKKTVRQPRPYCEFPATVAYFKKKKASHSFPSQSVQTLCVAWCALVDSPEPDGAGALFLVRLGTYYFAALMMLVGAVRIYRGLHYPHDVVAAVLIARSVVTSVAYLLHSLAGSKSIAALLVGCFSATELSEHQD